MTGTLDHLDKDTHVDTDTKDKLDKVNSSNDCRGNSYQAKGSHQINGSSFVPQVFRS